jgi:leader peptidase (prepilin peptidase)/N-methyltransferase
LLRPGHLRPVPAGPPGPAIVGWVFLSILTAATFIDFDHLMIPDALTIGGAAIGVILSFLVPALHGQHGGYFALDALRSAGAAILGTLIGSGLLFWVATLAEAALKKEAMGFGDVKLIGAIGAFCGWHGAVFALFGGAVVGTFGLAAVLAVRGLRRSKAAPALQLGSPIPFGPMLAAAGALYFLLLRGPVDRWFAQVSQLF